MPRPKLRHVFVALLLLTALIGQVTWALAGTTGGIAGVVTDDKGAPVANAAVTAVAASQTASTTTDAGGHFVFLTLSPDTYTVSITKSGYNPISNPGITVFADQQITLTFHMVAALKTIAAVTSTAATSLVKAGVGGDVYSVTPSQAAAAAPLGGGGNLYNAYSAMASVPGVQTSIGGFGWDNNAAYVRGQNSYYTGFEYDGIPINRAFDNYNASTESSLGLQQLQVYTGGGPASIASAGTAGFINQVIKTGTFPGFGTATLGLASPTFQHSADVEVGGASPSRNFSYYVGILGANAAGRFLDNANGAGFMQPGGIYSGDTLGFGIGYSGCTTVTCQGVKPICPLVGQVGVVPPQGCWAYYSGLTGVTSLTTDREAVVNLHFGVPGAHGMRDDIQALWSASALNQYWYSTPNDLGPGNAQFIQSLFGAPYAPPVCGPATVAPGLNVNACSAPTGTAYLPYADSIAYNLPFGTTISSSPASVSTPIVYSAPDTPAHPFMGPIPLSDQNVNVNQNDTGIVKLQYTHNLSENAYVRAYGYSFYSDWLETAPLNGSTGDAIFVGNGAAQYQLITHTRGASLQLEDQLTPKHLLSIGGNFTSASVTRLNNSSAYGGVSPIGYMALNGSTYTCYDPSSGTAVPCLTSRYYDVASGTRVSPAWTSDAASGPTGYGATAAGATWRSLWNGDITGSLNTVKPVFINASLSDEWRPSDRWLINGAIRYDDFTYDLPAAGAADQFYASQTANYTCVHPATSQVLTSPLAPGVPPPASALYVNGDCNAAVATLFPTSTILTGWVHPNGTTQDGVAAPLFSAASPSSYTLRYWEPRLSGTFTLNPDNVFRFSAGRFTQPPISASVQYFSASGDDRSVWNNTMNLGFYSPFHPIPGVSSAQYDFSWEHRFHGTDMTVKITPFFTWVHDWQQQTFIGASFVTQVPVGVNRVEGAELAFSKGDFNREGLSGSLAVTYTNSKIKFQSIPLGAGVVPNQVNALNQAIQEYNQLAKGGTDNFPCFTAADPATGSPGTGVASCGAGDIANPYFNAPAQPLIDPNGWYAPYTTAIAPNLSGANESYISPWTMALILNYRHQKFAITPSLQLATGGYYGSPLDVEGVDPRACSANQAATGVVAPGSGTAQNCDYTSLIAPGFGQFSYLYIPNPETGKFAFLNYQEPAVLTGNLQLTYDASKNVTLVLTAANLFHTCFGGSSEPWTKANPPGRNICGYAAAGGSLNSTVYPSNFYNGTGYNDMTANGAATPPVFQHSYVPSAINSGAIGGSIVAPLNIFFNVQIKV